MTGLQRAVKRKTGEYERGREIVVQIGPDGITLWPLRCRSQAVTVSSFRSVFWWAARVQVGIEKAAKAKARKAKR